MIWLLVMPLVVPLIASSLGFMLWRSEGLQRPLGVVAMILLLASSLALLAAVWQQGILVVQLGDWAAPFGISLVADHLSVTMVVLNAVMATTALIYSLSNIDAARTRYGYYPLFHILLVGINGAFLTGDIFNLFVFFEIILIASFVLLALGSERKQVDGAVKYVIINLVASALLLSGVAVIYGLTGTLNMADLSLKVAEVEDVGLVTTISMMFLVAFGIKAGIFPLFFWLPAAYHTPPVAVSALFAGILTKVGVYSLIRFFTLIFTQDVAYTQAVLIVIAGLTMVIGVFGAVVQNEFRRILAFHSVSQVGYMVMGLALYTPLAVAGSVIFMIHHSVVKSNLFLVSGVSERIYGTFELDKLGGIYRSFPLLSGLFVLSAFSLAGFPPLSGFWAKYLLVLAGLEVEAYLLVAAALFTGVFTLYSMTKIWNKAFWMSGKSEPTGVPPLSSSALMVPVIFLALFTLFIGVFFEPFMALAERAAADVFDVEGYVRAVLGDAP